jgi:hypothetical protein
LSHTERLDELLKEHLSWVRRRTICWNATHKIL